MVGSPAGSKDSSNGSALTGSVVATDTGVVVVVVVVVVVGIELGEVLSDFFIVAGPVVREVEGGDISGVEVVELAIFADVPGVTAKLSTAIELSVDATPVVAVDVTSGAELFSSDCVPENKLPTRDTARLPIRKPATDKSGVVDCLSVLLAGSGGAFSALGFTSLIANVATPTTAAPKSNRTVVLCQLFPSTGCTAIHPISHLFH